MTTYTEGPPSHPSRSRGNTLKARLDIIRKEDPVKAICSQFDINKKALDADRTKWLNVKKEWVGYREQKQKTKGRSNLHFPMIYQQVEMEVARSIVSYFSQKPYTSVRPTNPQTVESSRMMEETLQFYADTCPVYFLSRLQIAKFTRLFGAGYVVPSWRTVKRMVRATNQWTFKGYQMPPEEVMVEGITYQGPWYDVYSPLEVFPYPFAKNMETMPEIIIEEFVHITELEKRAKQGAFDLAKVNMVPLSGAGQEDGNYPTLRRETGQTSLDTDNDVVQLLHSFKRDRFRTVANRQTLIRDTHNFLDHGEIPVVQHQAIMDPDSFHPVSPASKLLGLQKMAEMNKNNAISAQTANLWPVFKYRRGQGVDPRQLHFLPGNRIAVKQIDDVDVIRPPELKRDVWEIEGVLDSVRQEITGYFSSQRGYSERKNTATSDSIFQAEGNKRIEYELMVSEHTGFIAEARQTAKNVQQYMEDDTWLRINGVGGNMFQQVSPDMIRGDYTYVVSGASEAMNRAVAQQQLINLLGVVSGMTQFVRLEDGTISPVPLIDGYGFLNETLQGFNRNFPDRMLLRPELFGAPLNNRVLDINAQQAPGFDQLSVQPGTGARSASPFGQSVNRLPRTTNMGQITGNANRLTQAGVSL